MTIAYRWARDQYEKLPGLAVELVRLPVSVLFAGGGSNTALAAKAATSSIPVVFVIAADPVGIGLVNSLNRPGGNLTGIANFTAELTSKRLELLHELVPSASVIGFLQDKNARADDTLQKTANQTGVRLETIKASNAHDIDAAFSELTRREVGAVVVQNTPLFLNQRDQVIALAATHALPAVYERPEVARAGGLMSYGTSFAESNREAGVYVGRILNGEKPSDLPVMLPTKFELVINLRTAKALGLPVPPKLYALATEIIE
jgi:putative ABC transport system substrate-binding protein